MSYTILAVHTNLLNKNYILGKDMKLEFHQGLIPKDIFVTETREEAEKILIGILRFYPNYFCRIVEVSCVLWQLSYNLKNTANRYVGNYDSTEKMFEDIERGVIWRDRGDVERLDEIIIKQFTTDWYRTVGN